MCINTCGNHLYLAVHEEYQDYIVKQDLLPKEIGKEVRIHIKMDSTNGSCRYCSATSLYFVTWENN